MERLRRIASALPPMLLGVAPQAHANSATTYTCFGQPATIVGPPGGGLIEGTLATT